MLGLLNPVQQCCCAEGERPWPKGTKIGDTDPIDNRPQPTVHSTAAELLVGTRRMCSGLPVGPMERTVPTYATADHEILQGEPLYTGSILQLTLGESIHEMSLALHVNGFSLTPCDFGPHSVHPRPISRAWSPFSLVEKCQVKTMQHSAYWAVFKLTVFSKEGQDRCYYFATTGGNAYKERDKWVVEMVTAISNVTMSLFPPHAITVQPIPGVATTTTRIMAGYLLQSGHQDSVSLFYCELHAYSGGEARMAIYKDEWCQQEVAIIALADSSTVSTRKGTYCTVFGVDQHRFCARTREEKDLWLRAVSNIKVKLMFDAPDPTDEELEIFRAAVHERVEELKGAVEIPGDPLLAAVPRAPPMSPRGDSWDPDPIDEDANSQDDFNDFTDMDSFDDDGFAHVGQDKVVVGGLEPEDCRKLLQTVSRNMNDGGGGVFAQKPGAELVHQDPAADDVGDEQAMITRVPEPSHGTAAPTAAMSETTPGQGHEIGSTELEESRRQAMTAKADGQGHADRQTPQAFGGTQSICASAEEYPCYQTCMPSQTPNAEQGLEASKRPDWTPGAPLPSRQVERQPDDRHAALLRQQEMEGELARRNRPAQSSPRAV